MFRFIRFFGKVAICWILLHYFIILLVTWLVAVICSFYVLLNLVISLPSSVLVPTITTQVNINNPDWDTSAPFGGYKQSGNGREYAVWGLHDYLETKAIIGYGKPKSAGASDGAAAEK